MRFKRSGLKTTGQRNLSLVSERDTARSLVALEPAQSLLHQRVMNSYSPNPFYLEAVQAYLEQNAAKLKALLESDRLSRIEKELIQARLLIREKKWTRCELNLGLLSTGNSFDEAERNFLLANIAGFNANWEKAILFNEASLRNYELCRYQPGLFLTHYNLSVDYSALGLFQISMNYLMKAQKLSESPSQNLQILRAQAWTSLNQGRIQAALDFITQGMASIESVQPSEKNMFLAVAADIYFRTGHTETAYEIMQGLKLSKSLRDKSRIHFEFKLLEKMKFEKPPYKTLDVASDEIQFSKEYSLKWSVLRYLLGGEIDLAEKFWAQLCEQFPLFYAGGFRCLHPLEAKSIFMTFLSRLLKAGVDKATQSAEAGGHYSAKQNQLLQILRDHPTGLRKEDLIEKIWKQKYDPSMDSKLYKLIQRTRALPEFEVISFNQCYHLKKASS